MSDIKKSIIQQKIEEGATVEQLKNETSCYCPLPWVHLHISTIGEVLPCCISEWGQAPLGNINNNSLSPCLSYSINLSEIGFKFALTLTNAFTFI